MESCQRPRPTRRPVLALACGLGALVAASCTDDAAGPFVPEPTTIVLDPATIELGALGRSAPLSAIVLDQQGTAMAGAVLTWVSEDPSVAAVSDGGVVTSVSNGRTVIHVRAGSAEASLGVVVSQVVAALTIVSDSLLLDDPGDTVAVAAELLDAESVPVAGAPVTWSSADTAVASVAATGTVRGRGTGSTWVRAASGGARDSVLVRVRPELSIEVVGTFPVAATVDTEVPLVAVVSDLLGTPYEGAPVSWTVAAGSGAIVSPTETLSDASGTVTGVWKLGTAAGTQQAFASVRTRGETRVVAFLAEAGAGAPVAVSLVADSVLLSARGETARLAPTYLDAFGNVAEDPGGTWASSDPSAASVTGDGLLTGGDAGSAWITASLDGSVRDSILVTVVMRGAITVTFDDGFLSVYENAWPELQAFGIAANVAVNPTPVDEGWGDYMTRAMLDEMSAAGWSIVSHTLKHDSLPSLSAEELDHDLRSSQQWIIDAGYRGWNVFVAPYHAYGDAERLAVSDYYAASRGVSATAFSPDSLVAWQPDDRHQLTGLEAEVLPYTTPAGRDDLRAVLQRTVDEGRFVDLFFHRVPPADVAAFRDVLQILTEFGDRVLPYHELFPDQARVVQ